MSTSDETTTNQQHVTEAGQVPTPPAMTFSWWNLGTTDSNAAKSFYTGLFGWDVVETPISDGVYTTFRKDGKDVCATYQMGSEMIGQGVPPHWLSYISVDSADDTAAKAAENNGVVVMPPFDVMEFGRMTVIRDPQGATVGLWQPRTHKGAGLMNQLGGVCWNELNTTDAAGANAFYSGVFGWTPNEQQMGPMTYTTYMRGTSAVGGMMQMSEEWGEAGKVHPHWMPYFWVADCDASVATATELGAQVMVPPMDIEGVGRMAMLRDPQGAFFSIIRMEMPGQ